MKLVIVLSAFALGSVAFADNYTCRCEIPRYGENEIYATVDCPAADSENDLDCSGYTSGTYYLNVVCQNTETNASNTNYTQMGASDPTSPINCGWE